MIHKFIASTLAVLPALFSVAFAADVFPNQPNIQGAFNKLMNVLSHLEKSKLNDGHDAQKHIGEAIVDLSAARTFIEQSTNNKGTYRVTAIKLCDDAKEALTANPPNVAKANEITNHALKEVNMAGRAGSHR
jgi:hypothetical protein